MSRPRILVTTSRGKAAEEYLDALREAGADPVLADAGDAPPTLEGFNGLLLTGGADVDPAQYGAAPSELIGPVEPERDELEVKLVREAREIRLPTLCICRGAQLANVAFGGSLVADIPAALGAAPGVPHEVLGGDGRSERGVIPQHVVRIQPGSLLARTVRALDLPTGGRHHQAVDRCAADLRVVGRTDDGVVEALEARFESPFWLAVQWHPESTRDEDGGASRKLFSAFRSAAQAHDAARRPGRHPTEDAWLAGLRDSQRMRAEVMIDRLERLGDADAIATVRSEIEEDIPQTARWIAVRPLWEIIDGWRKSDALTALIREARIDPAAAFSDAWLAAHRMLEAGVPANDVAAFARGVAFASIFQTLFHLDDGSGNLPADWEESDDLPSWALMETRDDELTGRRLEGLYEDLLAADPSGREGAPPPSGENEG